MNDFGRVKGSHRAVRRRKISFHNPDDTSIIEERNKRVADLHEQARAERARIYDELHHYRPIGQASDLGSVLLGGGVKPRRGEALSTPVGTFLFAKDRKPTETQVRDWYASEKKAQDLNSEAAKVRSAAGVDELLSGNDVTIGNRNYLATIREANDKGLLTSSEHDSYVKLQKFWDEHPDAESGVVHNGVIDPIMPSRGSYHHEVATKKMMDDRGNLKPGRTGRYEYR